MKPPALVDALADAAERLGVRVRRERGGFRGGFCVVAGEPTVVLNRQHPPEAHLAALADALAQLPTEQLYLRPTVRAALDDLLAQRRAGVLDTPEAAEPDADA